MAHEELLIIDFTKHESFNDIKEVIASFPETEKLTKFKTIEEGEEFSVKLSDWLYRAERVWMAGRIVMHPPDPKYGFTLSVDPLFEYAVLLCELGDRLLKAERASSKISQRVLEKYHEEDRKKWLRK